MSRFLCKPRYSHLIPEQMRQPDLESLEKLVLHPDGPGWQFSEAGIDYHLDDGSRLHMTVLHDSDLGYHLQYLGPKGCFGPDTIWFSLGDSSRLQETVCPDDWEVSAGLFISKPSAWTAIRHFCNTGKRTEAISWLSLKDIPDNCMW